MGDCRWGWKSLRGLSSLILLVLVAAAAHADDLPFDPSMIDQLTPEQRQQALEAIGAMTPIDGSSATSSAGASISTGYAQDLRQRAGRLGNGSYNDIQNGTGSRDCGYGMVWSTDRTDKTADDRVDLSGSRRAPHCVKLDTSNQTFSATDENIRPFGYDLFQTTPSTFAPTNDVPVPEDYVLGPGDTLRAQLFGADNRVLTLRVGRNGTIDFPKLGPITVAGLSFDDAKAAIESRAQKELIGVTASVTLGALRSISVLLVGDVRHPGTYTLSSLATITNALLSGGGVSPVGSLRRIELKRDGKLLQTFDLYDLLLRGDSTGDVRLLSGDVIFVPPVGRRITVAGEVKRPAIYELSHEATVGQALALAGGLLPSTNTHAVLLARYSGHHTRTLEQIDIGKPTALALKIDDGDEIRVRGVAADVDNTISVYGLVKYAGSYQWRENQTLGDEIAVAEPRHDLSGQEVYMQMGLLERINLASGVREMSAFDLHEVLANPAQSMPLQRGDRIIIFSVDDINFLGSREVREIVAPQPAGNLFAADSAGSTAGPNAAQTQARNNELAMDPLVQSGASLNPAAAGASLGSGAAAAASNYTLNADGQLVPLQQRQSASGSNGQPSSLNSSNAAATGANATAAQRPCRGLLGLVRLVNSQRGARFAKLFNFENVRAGVAEQQTGRELRCPRVFDDIPQALPFALQQAVAVYGEVEFPGLYPIASGTAMDSVIASAGGLTTESDRNNVEYVSYSAALEAGHSTYQKLKTTADIALSPGDFVNFKALYVGQEVGSVKVAGEFRFPGYYSILRGERLSHLIVRAGGLTDYAYPYGAIFTRRSARTAERMANQRAAHELQESIATAITSGALAGNAASSSQLLTSLVDRLENEVPIGRVSIEADPVVLDVHPEEDPILEPDDAIFVPKRPISVTVIGQVLNPGSLAFKSGLTAKQYIERAGGFSQAADSSRAFVILPNGTARKLHLSSWNFHQDPIPPGSSIVIPRDATPFNLLAFSERTFGILSNLALTAAALATVSRN